MLWKKGVSLEDKNYFIRRASAKGVILRFQETFRVIKELGLP
jgi:hypothetical protein